MWINEKLEQQDSTGQHHSMDMAMMESDAGGEVGCKAAKRSLKCALCSVGVGAKCISRWEASIPAKFRPS